MSNQAYQSDKNGMLDNNNVIPVLNADITNTNTTTTTTTSTTAPSSTTTASADSRAVDNAYPAYTVDSNPSLQSVTQDVRSSQMSTSAGTDSGIGLDRKSSLKGSKTSKGAEVKKAFSSAFSNFTDKIKNTFDDGVSDDIDSMSLQTDTSDDDDFEQLSLDDTDEVPAFIHEGRSETGSNPDSYSDMDTSSIYADSSTTKGREMVSGARVVEMMLIMMMIIVMIVHDCGDVVTCVYPVCTLIAPPPRTRDGKCFNSSKDGVHLLLGVRSLHNQGCSGDEWHLLQFLFSS